MKKLLYAIFISVILCGATACRKYVEIEPENLRVLKLTADYQNLLYNSTVMDLSYFKPIYSGDDIASDDIKWQNTLAVTTGNMYIWADRVYGFNEEDVDWVNSYKQIFICNQVLLGVMSSEGGSQIQKEAAYASALVHRAYAYYTLVNLYAKQYDPESANTDPGIPLVTQPNFTADLTRASVKAVYDFIAADLMRALPALPDQPDFISNPSKPAVYAMLSRVALNRRDFVEAKRTADLALTFKRGLIDLSSNVAVGSALPTMPLKFQNPEEIFFKRTPSLNPAIPLSPDALAVFTYSPAAAKDLRYVNFTVSGSTLFNSPFTTLAYRRASLAGDGTYTGPSVPEMLLIKAECEARAGNTNAALDLLNELRKKRFKPADYADLSAANATVALGLVLDERKREFMGRGFRWFDQRRLSKDAGLVKTVTKVFKDVTYTLQPGSNRYTYAIADKYTQLNPEIVQNPR
ncbi:RagB/SusD family nutrient uptake outer membrane protein [Pedobacter sp. MC2016-24]|uniref:RagB/SusD family nutrient uptake outer membrane protein n=1 Tax=Pedobacter sp. MC2016-24 TaxID=2780090 RepID=UPI001882149F|nr:RagB/SusD family nutrient uptake outer membrane protein [Pedobacter sp. MC2016-24]MBE9602431.1 RagB/SusD family nutrient uptake outer membrane protein [Pedobacter sp. MC2016-24]